MKRDRARVQGAGRIAGSALRVHEALLSRPVNTIGRLATDTGQSVPAVTDSLKALEQLALVREITGRRRGRVFSYVSYLDALQQGMEPL